MPMGQTAPYFGSGKLTTSHEGTLEAKYKYTTRWEPVTDAQLQAAIRQKGHDFFNIAAHLRVYPVLQLSIGLRF